MGSKVNIVQIGFHIQNRIIRCDHSISVMEFSLVRPLVKRQLGVMGKQFGNYYPRVKDPFKYVCMTRFSANSFIIYYSYL